MRYNDEPRMTNDKISANAPASATLPRGKQTTNGRREALFLSFVLRRSFGIRHSAFVICMAFATLSISAEPPPSARDILASVRMVEARQQLDLQGQLRENEIIVPFRLTDRKSVV